MSCTSDNEFRNSLLVSRPVRQALALYTLKSFRRPFPVIEAETGAMMRQRGVVPQFGF